MATPTSLPATFVAGNVLTAAQMNSLRGAFRIQQVVSTTKTDTFSAAISATWTDVTGLNLSITPTSATSKVLISVNMPLLDNGTSGGQTFLKVTRDGTDIGVGDAAGNRTQVGLGQIIANSNRPQGSSFQFLDSPASTSALDYQVEVWSLSYTVYVNRAATDSNSSNYPRSSCTITAMEVSA